MARAALEVNGAALVGASASGVLFNEPGVAFVKGRTACFGREAANAARRDSGHGYRNYWDLLSNDPLARPAKGFRTFADLAHAQLAGLWRRFREADEGIDGVILVVPAGAGDDRLSLLLGIAQEAGMPVAGLVESGVAAVPGVAGASACVHIDCSAERIVASRLEQRSSRVHSAELLFNGRPGLRHLRAAMTAYVAGRFIAASRFDPLELAATEHELDEQLDGWLQTLMAQGELKVELSGAPVPASASLRRDDFLAAIERQLGALANRLRACCAGPGAASVRLAAALAASPGCSDAFARLLPAEVQALQPGAAALGALARMPVAKEDARHYVLLRSLPSGGAPEEFSGRENAGQGRAGRSAVLPHEERENTSPLPTHLVLGGRAWRIDGPGLRLGSAPQSGGLAVILPPEAGVSRNHCTVVLEGGQVVLHDHSRYGTRLNGAAAAESAPLRGGDTIGIGPMEFLVTCEVGGDGA